MARKYVYEIAGVTYRTKAALEERIRSILYAVPLGTRLDGENLEFMYAVLERHPDADQKIGSGVAGIRVDRPPAYGGRCFFVDRDDGSSTDFSFKECLRPSTKLEQFKAAARNEIADQKIEFKLAFFRENAARRCPDTGELLTLDSAHVDHAGDYPFERILAEFIDTHRVDVDAVELTGKRQDNVAEERFAEPALAAAFARFHQERAKFEVVSRRANLSLRRRRQA